ncbi:MAG: arginine repressor [Lachnospiraceae bacterium]
MKARRHHKILELIQNFRIETQEELAEKLEQAGFAVTQATVSRDIRELRLTKTPHADGKQYYQIPAAAEQPMDDKYRRVLKDGFVSATAAGNLLVLKTVSGMAMAVAAAIDAISWPEVLGCIAGDDTIFCAVHSAKEGEAVLQKLLKMVG